MIDLDHLLKVATDVLGPHFGDADDRYYEAFKPLVMVSLITELKERRAQDGPPEERRKKIRHTPEDESCAAWMFGLILRINAGAKKPVIEKWADEIRLMRERDGRTDAEIRALFAWANQDDFWCANIRCPVTLRRQWDQLTVKMNRPKRSVQHGGKFNFADADRSGDRAAQAGTMKRRGINVPAGDVDL